MAKEPISVVISFSHSGTGVVAEKLQHQIKAVNSRIKLSDIGNLLKADNQRNGSIQERIDAILADAEVYCGGAINDIVRRAPKLKWIQSVVAGVNQYLTPELITSSIIITKARIHDRQISENIFNYILMLARRSLDYYRAQVEGKRARFDPIILHKSTIGILGLGNIGQRTAKIAKVFGMKVIATRAHPERHDPNVDLMLPPERLPELLRQSDFVVDLLPITAETKNVIGEAELKLMKSTAFFINVGRGATVNTEALIHAFKENWIAGAALDTLASDPGPWPEALLANQNVIVTPHVSGPRPDYDELLTKQFCQNLRRYIKGGQLLNIVDKKKGY